MNVRIGVVGPCAAGKSTLVKNLRHLGYETRHIAQEHSYVPDMWKRIARPDVLIYLKVSYPLTLERRKLNWSEQEYVIQLQRLDNAVQNADLVLDTDQLNPAQVLEQVLLFLKRRGYNRQ